MRRTSRRQLLDGPAQADRDAIGRAARKSYETLDTVMEQSFDAQLDDLKMAAATVRVVTIKEAAQFEVATNYRTGAQST